MRKTFPSAFAGFLLFSSLTMLAGCGGGSSGHDTTFYVDAAGACGGNSLCYSSIQSAIDAASTEDIVQVFPGTYHEDVVLKSGVIVRGAGVATTIIDGTGTGSVVTAVGVDADARLEGFTITGGGGNVRGGGIRLENSSPKLSDLIVTGNSAIDGGGIYTLNAFPSISNTTISGNTATQGSGAGLYIEEDAAPQLDHCTITGNVNATGQLGGGVFNSSVLSISPPVIKDTAITQNQGFYGGGVFNAHDAYLVVIGATITNNSAYQGGGIYNDGKPEVRNTTIAGNSASTYGGGMFNYDNSRAVVSGTVIRGNRAIYGGGIYNQRAFPSIVNCNVIGNEGYGGGGIYSTGGTPAVKNSIVMSNSGGGIYGSGTMDYNDVWNNSNYDYAGGASAGGHSISADPVFVSAANFDYHLQSGSPCIDVATNAEVPASLTTDFYGNQRIADGNLDGTAIVDIGIAEAPDTLAVSVTVPASGEAVQGTVTLQASATSAAAVFFTVRRFDGASGSPVGYENLPAVFDPVAGAWRYQLDTTALEDGYYLVFATAASGMGATRVSDVVPFSIRNLTTISLLPATPSNKAGRTMPIKFALKIAAGVDPLQPFVHNEDLEITIYKATDPATPLQTSRYGLFFTDYRIDDVGQLYITNFKTDRTPSSYVVIISQGSFELGRFSFETVR